MQLKRSFEDIVNEFAHLMTRCERHPGEEEQVFIFHNNTESAGKFVEAVENSDLCAEVVLHKGPFVKIHYTQSSQKFDSMCLEKGEVLMLPKEGKCRVIEIDNSCRGQKTIKLLVLGNKSKSFIKTDNLMEELSKKHDFHFHILHGINGESYWKTAGFLARNSSIHIRTTPSTHEEELKKYRDVTGCNSDEINRLIEDKFIIYNPNQQTWSTNASLTFKEPSSEVKDWLVFPENRVGEVDGVIKSENMVIYNKGYIWSLIKYGFRAGSVHDLKEIEEHLRLFENKLYMENFCAGFYYGSQACTNEL